jgi:hypothetical protein
VRSLEKFNVHLCQKVHIVVSCFQASAAPRPENLAPDEKDALSGSGFDTSITIFKVVIFRNKCNFKASNKALSMFLIS